MIEQLPPIRHHKNAVGGWTVTVGKFVVGGVEFRPYRREYWPLLDVPFEEHEGIFASGTMRELKAQLRDYIERTPTFKAKILKANRPKS